MSRVKASRISQTAVCAERRAGEQEQSSRYARSLLEASLDPLVTISADGKVGLLRVEYRPWDRHCDISHALKAGEDSADLAKTFTLSGLAEAPRVTLNGRPVEVRTAGQAASPFVPNTPLLAALSRPHCRPHGRPCPDPPVPALETQVQDYRWQARPPVLQRGEICGPAGALPPRAY